MLKTFCKMKKKTDVPENRERNAETASKILVSRRVLNLIYFI